ncbi:hypothetical protein LNKW23_30240 [Paralimibaculum aggregatum]|uniref:EfeO-type cupredoxin-like domain-containing protein n=1 Tax=Paralimibaculum aggregatum TaxID=3036245 RepID=A0ABQ6LNE7_9RHOB|nr:cupredoxin domain-containing protein [Limibaculum sp. NKW23]GMG83810.1 hypothetical protein LNKW23_30240 [Limibaculum sp. NKW23]
MFLLKTIPALAAAALLATTLPAAAVGEHGQGGGAGKPGKASQVTRTIAVTMYDNYYEPEAITLKEGETVRFVITNKGALVHEFNIGTPEAHVAHAPEMQMMVDHGVLEPDRINRDMAKQMQASMGHGMHDAPNSVLLEPGGTGEIIWTFPEHAELEFACNVPGHYDAGMAGEITLSH